MMDQEANRTPASANFEPLLNAGDLASHPEVFLDDARFHYPLDDLSGIEEIRNHLAAVRQAFPYIRFSILALIGESHHVACRWSLSATQAGVFAGKAGTGKEVSVPAARYALCREGHSQEIRVAFNPSLLV